MARGDQRFLGSHLTHEGTNFAIWAPSATKVELCLIDVVDGNFVETRHDLGDRSGPIYHGYFQGIRAGQRYGFRVYGPWEPQKGWRFNPNKLLMDPNAHILVGELQYVPEIYSHTASDGSGTGDVNVMDTRITALELLPIHQFITEPAVHARGRANHWGYNAIAFSAPHNSYAATDDPVAELREAVAKLHEAGIEVILDVVYNHTAEGGVNGPTLSFRGIDSRNFYRRSTDNDYDDFTGCGNTVDVRRPHVVRMIIDSLHWWCEEIGIDGFRFDLAAALARSHDEIDGISALIVAMVSDPVLRERKLIAEPWDTRGYALGFFPYPWREWNDKYRDALRKFWLAEAGGAAPTGVGELATRLSGSHDIFAYRGPTSTINFLTAHDGFTLNDVVTYTSKHNDANGEENRDGTDNNYSWNAGIEGVTNHFTINEIRQRLKKSMMSSLLLSSGIPMITMGDEVGRTQMGSNNAYSLPDHKRGEELRDEAAFNGGWALSWKYDAHQIDMLETTVNLIQLRKKYLMPVARMFFTGQLDLNTSRKDLAWFSRHGLEMTQADWDKLDNRSLMMYVEADEDSGMLIMFNGSILQKEFTLPGVRIGDSFRSVFDSAENVLHYSPRLAVPESKVILQAHAVQVWLVNRDIASK